MKDEKREWEGIEIVEHNRKSGKRRKKEKNGNGKKEAI